MKPEPRASFWLVWSAAIMTTTEAREREKICEGLKLPVDFEEGVAPAPLTLTACSVAFGVCAVTLAANARPRVAMTACLFLQKLQSIFEDPTREQNSIAWL